MTYRDLMIIREMLSKVVVRGDQEKVLLEMVDKIDALLAGQNQPSAA